MKKTAGVSFNRKLMNDSAAAQMAAEINACMRRQTPLDDKARNFIAENGHAWVSADGLADMWSNYADSPAAYAAYAAKTILAFYYSETMNLLDDGSDTEDIAAELEFFDAILRKVDWKTLQNFWNELCDKETVDKTERDLLAELEGVRAFFNTYMTMKFFITGDDWYNFNGHWYKED